MQYKIEKKLFKILHSSEIKISLEDVRKDHFHSPLPISIGLL
jgi:hypothetical protein